jgi:hypothetical protein
MDDITQLRIFSISFKKENAIQMLSNARILFNLSKKIKIKLHFKIFTISNDVTIHIMNTLFKTTK